MDLFKRNHFRFVFYNIFIQSIHLFYHKKLFSTHLFYKPFENTESANNYRDILYERTNILSLYLIQVITIKITKLEIIADKR